MDIGFIGLGKMGFPMARRLIEAKHQLVVFDQRQEAVDRLAALGAQAASSTKEVADRAEIVLASLPSLQASLEVATGTGGVIEGKRVRRFVDPPSGRTWRCGFTMPWPSATSCNSTVP
jgi:3-hydroxyisobutyrate dehydrogenase-like beta-hydroxyacid dehydrogenase